MKPIPVPRLLCACLFAALPLGAFADWPMHRGNPQLNGFSTMSAAEAPKEEWSFSAGNPV